VTLLAMVAHLASEVRVFPRNSLTR
jgi:hypothetical protein